MKVLFISNDPNIFDAKSATRARMRSYAGHLDELHVLSRAPRGARDEQEGALFLHPLPASSIRAFFMRTNRARRIIRAHGIDVISAQDPFEHGRAALAAVSGSRAKLHVQVHTDFLSPWFARESFLNRMRVRMADDILPHAAGIRTVSKRVQESLVARYGSRIPAPSVLPLPVPPPAPAATLPAHAYSFALLAVGRLEKEKRFGDILNALALVVEEYPRTGLFIAGSGRLRPFLERRVGDLGLRGRVLFLGERGDVQGLMQGASAFIQASAYEGYGSTLIEAARAHAPIITTDVGIVGEVLVPGVSALVSPPGDVEALKRNVCKLIEDNPLRRALAMRAAEAAEAHERAAGDLPARIAEDLAACLH